MKLYSAYVQDTDTEGVVKKYFLGTRRAETYEAAEDWFLSLCSQCDAKNLRGFFETGTSEIRIEEYDDGLSRYPNEDPLCPPSAILRDIKL